jgi:RNA polymerase sigma factor (sigma-70 family)
MNDLESIASRYGGLVYGVCRRALGNPHEAEDAAQTVFLIFLKKAHRLDRGDGMAAWFYRTAVYVCSNHIRARSRREPPTAPPPESPSERIWDEAKPHLDDAVARLPDRLQDAIVVHYLQGKTLGETAATLRCPVKTLEKRVGRGLDVLRRLLSRAGVAISSAALVALLQSEAGAAAPRSLPESLRGRSLPPPRPALPLRKLLFPATAALVVVAFLAGTLRRERVSEAPHGGETTTAGLKSSAAEREPVSASPGSSATGPTVLPRFPATFEEFFALFKRMHECPEAIDRWAALGIDLRIEELRAGVGRSDEHFVEGMIVEIFREWSDREPRLAAEWLYRACALLPSSLGWRPQRPDGSGPGNVTLLEIALGTWLLRDAAAVDAWFHGLPAGEARDAVAAEYAIAASRLNHGRFEDHAALLDGLPRTWARWVAAGFVAAEWARKDSRSAAAWILKLPPSNIDPSDPAQPPFTLTFSESQPPNLDPFASIQDRAPVKEDRQVALGKIARSWAAADLDAARRWSEGLPNELDRGEAMRAVAEVWVKTDSRAVLDYALAHPGADWRDSWLRIVAVDLARRDPAGAEVVVRRVSPEDQLAVLSDVLSAWARERPDQAGPAVVRAMAPFDDLNRELQTPLWTSAYSWATRDPRAAAAWAAGIKRADIREYALSTVGFAWMRSDPRAVLEWAATLPKEPARDELLRWAGVELAGTDIPLALRIATQMPADNREEALRRVGAEWGKQDPEIALAWARSLTPVEVRDACVITVLTGWAMRDPNAARAAIGSLVDETLKPQALALIQTAWMEVERARLRKQLLGD